ncbi:DUF5004 domain-containing protein [Hymenobacter chitinivorans]|uniref:Lipocalin-like protein n=1 Tax=Hymenobacter chitinivorans DSM 11115 TaxID=1121954 RepID=A0A2M9B5F5_9BACT|nr:hypothetical protein [Hymenobacter chitinivorans]PJJ53178.1 hypothetical protein CLV45_3836 [Hymenobacter chitinivorans DSM 11115]
MKTHFRFPMLALLAATTLVSSCTKDKENQPAPKTKTEMLSGKDWVLTGQTVTPGLRADDGTIVTDLFPYLDDCDKDDLMRYETSGSCVLNEGPSRCEPTSPQQYAGTWSFESNETVLKTSIQSLGNSSFNLVELNDNSLKLSGIRRIENAEYKFTYTYAKK